MSDSPDPVPLFGPEMHADPYGCYRRLRELCPVHWSEPFQAWIVTSYDAVAAASKSRTCGMKSATGDPLSLSKFSRTS